MPPVTTATTSRAPILAILDDDVAPAVLGPRAFVNPAEIAGNGADDDGNGVVDDESGALFTSRFGSIAGEPLGSVATGRTSTPEYGGHGSIVADIAARALGQSDARILGVGFAITTRTLEGFERCVDYLVDLKRRGHPIRVANASFGVVDKNPAMQARWRAAVEKLRAADIVLVCAAAEARSVAATPVAATATADMPSALGLDNIVTVAALDRFGNRAPFSGAGDVGALGVDVDARSVEGFRLRATGTSMAAPAVSAALAQWFAQYPAATAAQAKAALLSSSSNGALNVAALLSTPPR